MLDIAIKYEDQLQKLLANIAFDEKYKFAYSSSYRDAYKASTSTWSIHEFVSIHNNDILGYMRYSIDRDSMTANGMQIMSFSKPNIIFSKDLKRFLTDIFDKFKFRKLTYSCFVSNPIESQYDKLTLKYGGRIIGIKKEEDRLMDGEYYDLKLYEILRKDYLSSKSK